MDLGWKVKMEINMAHISNIQDICDLTKKNGRTNDKSWRGKMENKYVKYLTYMGKSVQLMEKVMGIHVMFFLDVDKHDGSFCHLRIKFI